ncbi:hypothetical protein [Kineosporia sp. NBRC 101731]|uniref:hypothetical protein n=1 Tax=Kineosporia sp. NBRC 101731 TaxID=3032199 RepID=UPI0024A383E0|nr:hypothetical protein [Kineosporia sp. NBRC 101731]GLY28117.1 hypothetical protein Kisp02_14820 [Kineosporia sp. NBRC 101731]
MPENDLLQGLGRSTPENAPDDVGRQVAVGVAATACLITVAVAAMFGLVMFGLWAVPEAIKVFHGWLVDRERGPELVQLAWLSPAE